MQINAIKIIPQPNDTVKIIINPMKFQVKTFYYLLFLLLYFLHHKFLNNNFEDFLFLGLLVIATYFTLLKYNTIFININHEKFELVTYPLPRIWGYKQELFKIAVDNVFITKEVSESEDNEIITEYCLYLSTIPTSFMNLSFDNYHDALAIKDILIKVWNIKIPPVVGEYLPQ